MRQDFASDFDAAVQMVCRAAARTSSSALTTLVLSMPCHAINILGAWPSDDRPFVVVVGGGRAYARKVARDLKVLDQRFGIAEDAADDPVRPGSAPPTSGGHSLRRTGVRGFF